MFWSFWTGCFVGALFTVMALLVFVFWGAMQLNAQDDRRDEHDPRIQVG